MKINVTKAGLWAEKGIKVVDVKEGVQDVSNNLASELINAGRASLYDEPVVVETIEPVAPEKTKPVKSKKIEPVIEKIEKTGAGWWCVKFETADYILKVRGKTEAEAIENAVEKLKVAE